jgi:hypothetical protein
MTRRSNIVAESFTTIFTISSGVVAPSAQPTSLTFTNVTSTSYDVSFTASVGGADGYVAFRRTGASPTFVPVDTTTYTVGNTYGDSTCQHFGAGVTFSESGLTPYTTYYYDVFAWSGTVGTYTYLTTSPLTNSQKTAINWGNALHFDGTNDAVTGNVNSVLAGSASLCYEFWFKNDTATFGATNRILFGTSNSGATAGWLVSALSGGKQITADIFNGGITRGIYALSDITVWNHIRVVYDGSQSTNATRLKMWVNGVQITFDSFAGTIPATIGTSGTPIIFGRFTIAALFFDGYLDNLCIWSNTTGSDTYRGGLGDDPSATGLIVHCKFNESNNSVTTADETGNDTFSLTGFNYDANSGFDLRT